MNKENKLVPGVDFKAAAQTPGQIQTKTKKSSRFQWFIMPSKGEIKHLNNIKC